MKNKLLIFGSLIFLLILASCIKERENICAEYSYQEVSCLNKVVLNLKNNTFIEYIDLFWEENGIYSGIYYAVWDSGKRQSGVIDLGYSNLCRERHISIAFKENKNYTENKPYIVREESTKPEIFGCKRWK